MKRSKLDQRKLSGSSHVEIDLKKTPTQDQNVRKHNFKQKLW